MFRILLLLLLLFVYYITHSIFLPIFLAQCFQLPVTLHTNFPQFLKRVVLHLNYICYMGQLNLV